MELKETMSPRDKTYVGLCVLFSAILITSTLTYKKIVYLSILPFHTFTLSVAVVICPLLFILSDLMAEFYDRKKAGFCVRIAIVVNLFVALMVSGMDYLQATPWSTVDDTRFHGVFGSYGLAFIACLFACYTAQIVDINVYLYLKKLTQGKWLWVRSNGSTAVSLLVDTFIAVGLLTLMGIYPKEHMWMVMMNAYSYKLFFTICNIPFFYLLVWMIRRFIAPKKAVKTSEALQLNVAQ